MARIDNPDTYNPFGWRLGDLTDPTLGPARRDALREELLVWEAAEVAHGYRHLTIAHGEPHDLDASRHLSAFYDTLSDLVDADDSGWVRARGADDAFVTITVRGPDADDRIARFSAAAHAANPGDWVVVESAYPPI